MLYDYVSPTYRPRWIDAAAWIITVASVPIVITYCLYTYLKDILHRKPPDIAY